MLGFTLHSSTLQRLCPPGFFIDSYMANRGYASVRQGPKGTLWYLVRVMGQQHELKSLDDFGDQQTSCSSVTMNL